MGVAVMTSTSGRTPLAMSVARCITPKRCCSSTTTSPSRENSTPSSSSACVPTASAARPLRTAARASFCSLPRACAPTRASSTPEPSSQPRSVRACCSARISVGAMMAACQPERIASMAAAKATAVLPLPTSPWSSRFMGSGRPMSAAISPKTRSCAPGEDERDARPRGQAGRRGSVEGDPGLPPDPAPPQRQRQLQEEELLEGQPPEGLGGPRRGRGPRPSPPAENGPVPAPRSAGAGSAAPAPAAGSSSTASGAYSSTSRFMSLRSAGCW